MNKQAKTKKNKEKNQEGEILPGLTSPTAAACQRMWGENSLTSSTNASSPSTPSGKYLTRTP